MNERIKGSVCKDIYKEEIEKEVKTLKRFRESWLGVDFRNNKELFLYADDDFYFYRFAISRMELSRTRLLNSIIYRVMETYEYEFLVPDTQKNVPFEFILIASGKKVGYKYEDFFEDEDVSDLLREYDVEKAFIIRNTSGCNTNHMKQRNEQYVEKKVAVEEITIQYFFETLFNHEEYIEFEKQIQDYVNLTKDILGFKSIKVLSAMHLSTQKMLAEKVLLDWNYEESRYHVIDESNEKIRDFLDVKDYNFGSEWEKIKAVYLSEGVYKAMIGKESFADSFITSEWLYHSLKGKDNFDYTAIVSGYLKSIEQLLHKLVLLNIDNNCVISMRKDRKTKSAVLKQGIIVYEITKEGEKRNAKDIWKTSFPYIDFIDTQKEYMDSSIGTFEYFFRNNPHILSEPKLSNVICNMVSCFRTECRNGHFHTHNLHDLTIVEKTRENAILLYALLLGCVEKAKVCKDKLGIYTEDKFDAICKEIRRIRHFSSDFIFEYADGSKKKMIYDYLNNTMEYTEDGIEHYEALIFYEVEDFSMKTYEMLETPIRDEWKRLLTRDNLPNRIYCYDRKKNIHEIPNLKI